MKHKIGNVYLVAGEAYILAQTGFAKVNLISLENSNRRTHERDANIHDVGDDTLKSMGEWRGKMPEFIGAFVADENGVPVLVRQRTVTLSVTVQVTTGGNTMPEDKASQVVLAALGDANVDYLGVTPTHVDGEGL